MKRLFWLMLLLAVFGPSLVCAKSGEFFRPPNACTDVPAGILEVGDRCIETDGDKKRWNGSSWELDHITLNQAATAGSIVSLPTTFNAKIGGSGPIIMPVKEYTFASLPVTCLNGVVAKLSDKIGGYLKCAGNKWSPMALVNAEDFGASGSKEYTTASGSAGQNQITLAAAKDFRNGDDVAIYEAGGPTDLPTPQAPTVTTQGMTGSDTCYYRIAAVDQEYGTTALSAAGSVLTCVDSPTRGQLTILEWTPIRPDAEIVDPGTDDPIADGDPLVALETADNICLADDEAKGIVRVFIGPTHVWHDSDGDCDLDTGTITWLVGSSDSEVSADGTAVAEGFLMANGWAFDDLDGNGIYDPTDEALFVDYKNHLQYDAPTPAYSDPDPNLISTSDPQKALYYQIFRAINPTEPDDLSEYTLVGRVWETYSCEFRGPEPGFKCRWRDGWRAGESLLTAGANAPATLSTDPTEYPLKRILRTTVTAGEGTPTLTVQANLDTGITSKYITHDDTDALQACSDAVWSDMYPWGGAAYVASVIKGSKFCNLSKGYYHVYAPIRFQADDGVVSLNGRAIVDAHWNDVFIDPNFTQAVRTFRNLGFFRYNRAFALENTDPSEPQRTARWSCMGCYFHAGQVIWWNEVDGDVTFQLLDWAASDTKFFFGKSDASHLLDMHQAFIPNDEGWEGGVIEGLGGINIHTRGIHAADRQDGIDDSDQAWIKCYDWCLWRGESIRAGGEGGVGLSVAYANGSLTKKLKGGMYGVSAVELAFGKDVSFSETQGQGIVLKNGAYLSRLTGNPLSGSFDDGSWNKMMDSTKYGLFDSSLIGGYGTQSLITIEDPERGRLSNSKADSRMKLLSLSYRGEDMCSADSENLLGGAGQFHSSIAGSGDDIQTVVLSGTAYDGRDGYEYSFSDDGDGTEELSLIIQKTFTSGGLSEGFYSLTFWYQSQGLKNMAASVGTTANNYGNAMVLLEDTGGTWVKKTYSFTVGPDADAANDEFQYKFFGELRDRNAFLRVASPIMIAKGYRPCGYVDTNDLLPLQASSRTFVSEGLPGGSPSINGLFAFDRSGNGIIGFCSRGGAWGGCGIGSGSGAKLLPEGNNVYEFHSDIPNYGAQLKLYTNGSLKWFFLPGNYLGSVGGDALVFSNPSNQLAFGLKQDGTVAFPGASANGQRLDIKPIATTTLNSSAGATLTATNLIPAGSLVLGVTVRVTTAFGTINGLTDFDIGDGTDQDAWGAAIAISGGTTTTIADFTQTSPQYYPSATSVVLTGNGGTGFDGTGQVRITVHYLSLISATS